MFNKVILIGRLGQNPELKTSNAGKSYCNFTLATNSGFGDNKQTDWHSVTAFNKTAELVHQYLKKGSLVAVEGRIQYQKIEKDGVKHTFTKIIADNVTFIGGKDESASQHVDEQPKAQPPMSDDTFEGYSLDEPIPF